ncbi:MAG: hypothetical protein IT440_01085 [Phycisphaeraceae bacterium]|nr:hypothetical protein [Phycisphaeraceae bacterium]
MLTDQKRWATLTVATVLGAGALLWTGCEDHSNDTQPIAPATPNQATPDDGATPATPTTPATPATPAMPQTPLQENPSAPTR